MPDEVLEINVGGRIFSCLRSTLCKEPESMLAKMMDPDSKFGELVKDPSGRPFIDRDGDIFATILKFLRNNGGLARPHELSLDDLSDLKYEADFYSLQSLEEFIEEELKKRNDAEERKRKEREDEEYEEKRKMIRRKWGYDFHNSSENRPVQNTYFSLTVDPDKNIGEVVDGYTCGPNNYEHYRVHTVVPILKDGTTTKLQVLIEGDYVHTSSGPTREEAAFLD